VKAGIQGTRVKVRAGIYKKQQRVKMRAGVKNTCSGTEDVQFVLTQYNTHPTFTCPRMSGKDLFTSSSFLAASLGMGVV
jgi:hypothetical protein